jgi:ABC-type transport system involved in multi-copper enzyme maturation permease subunit
MSTKNHSEESSLKEFGQKQSLPFTRSVSQISDTIMFELLKNLRKCLILAGIGIFLVILSYITILFQFPDGISIDEIRFDQYLLSNVTLFLSISCCALAGSIIVADFEKETKNILFPQIGRNRLFIGRIISVIFMQVLVLGTYYLAVAGFTLYQFRSVPISLGLSFLWAILYAISLLAFVTFFSSFMRSVTATVVLSFVLLFLVYSMIIGIMSFSTEAEPLWILTYYGYFITSIMDMPKIRYIDQTIDTGGQTLPLHIWLTPSQEGFFWGLLIHIVIFLSVAYILFRIRQEK